MANAEQLELLKSGVEAWNKWREENPEEEIDLLNADLIEANLSRANLSGADLSNANLSNANLSSANLTNANILYAHFEDADLSYAKLLLVHARDENHEFIIAQEERFKGYFIESINYEEGSSEDDLPYMLPTDIRWKSAFFYRANLEDANLSHAYLREADLREANLTNANIKKANLKEADLEAALLPRADLSGADLSGANLSGAVIWFADLSGANLSGANLEGANMVYAKLINVNFVGAKVSNAKFSNSHVYGVNIWDLQGEVKEQNELVISQNGAPEITVDNIKVAQFVYLILNNAEIRGVLNTLTTKSVLILGRFADPSRKAVLDGLREKLRELNLLPIVFDFERPNDKDYTETVQTLAGLSLFVIVDVTSPKSTPLEMEATVKQFKIPFVPIIDISVDPRPYAMIVDSQNSFHWVLPTFGYESKEQLLDNIEPIIINRALEKHNELRKQKANVQEILTLADLKK